MKMDKVAGSGNDEFYTPEYAVRPIVPYLEPECKIWCPFDTEESLFVKVFRESGFEVVHTHISNGKDFFNEWVDCDYIVSNPPYSMKTEVLQRLFERDTPFAMLVGVVGLFESKRRFELFRDNYFEIMYFNKRISFLRSYQDDKPMINPPFSSVYVCRDVLPAQIMFEEFEV